jgi:hypothetical protein
MPLENNDHVELRELLEDNQKLLEQNNDLLRKLHKQSILAFVFRVVGFLIIIGAPVALFYYVIEPYFTSVSASIESFSIGLNEVPGWTQLKSALGGG